MSVESADARWMAWRLEERQEADGWGGWPAEASVLVAAVVEVWKRRPVVGEVGG